MSEYEDKLKHYMSENNIDGDLLSLGESCHTVQDAADAVGADVDEIIKNICLVDSEGNFIVAIVKGAHRVSTSRVAKVLGVESARTATPEEILESSGYPVGGVPSFGFEAQFLIDPKVMEKEIVYSSGGSTTSLLKVSTKVLADSNNGKLVRIRK
ncbi:MAG: aminoacyl-tRNA deacylase [Candidatus Thorarchaeota archaeon]|jgi:prolyl-tRNA editing enzyme YbaK/EbsC (Cys-tRNA(Pro) deacylase)